LPSGKLADRYVFGIATGCHGGVTTSGPGAGVLAGAAKTFAPGTGARVNVGVTTSGPVVEVATTAGAAGLANTFAPGTGLSVNAGVDDERLR
jgi:hypothetical protein